MIYLRIFAIFISLLGFGEKCHADGNIEPPSVSSGKIMILPPPEYKPEQMTYDTGSGSIKIFKSGAWLALTCIADKCRLVPVRLKVTANKLKQGQPSEFFIPQTMTWNLSAVSKDENIVMFVMPHADLTLGAVRTWYASQSGYHEYASVGKETVIATDSADMPHRQSILVPLAVTNKSCTKTQADNRECLRTTIHLQLREGKIHQWMGAPTSDPCFPIGDDANLPVNYLRWVGDLDHDQKPDYIINLGSADGYILSLSSRATPRQLVGEVGYYKPGIQCD